MWLVAVLLVIAQATAAIAEESIVHTDLGDVRGVLYESYRAFKGIPYIQPPVKELRFAKPLPAKSWAPLILNANTFKPGCPQRCVLPPGVCPTQQSEDCIYLNIFTPRNSQSKNLPVMLWIPGGHFEQGSAGTPLYDGGFLSSNQSQMILVSVNNRLGALGWVTDKSIPELADGNLGLLDLIEALQWTQRNIANFGGNPNAITLAGQSAGATCIAALMISPKTKGLFHRVILQSNPISLPFRYRNDASDLGKTFRKNLSCHSIECLRSKSVEEIVKAQHDAADKISIIEPLVSFLPWAPTVDGKLVPMRFLDAIKNNLYHKDASGAPMPMMLGNLAEEAVIFVHMATNKKLHAAAYIAAVTVIFRTSAFGVLSRYPPTPFFGDERPQVSNLVTDYLFTCVTRNVASQIQQHDKSSGNVYLYRFNHSLSFDAWGPKYPYCKGHSCHGAELPILFHQSATGNMSEKEQALSQEMMHYWSNFVWTGNPNIRPKHLEQVKLPEWPAFNAKDPSHLEFTSDSTFAIKGYNKKNCNYFDDIGYAKGAG
jgi:carboxylesterase type B